MLASCNYGRINMLMEKHLLYCVSLLVVPCVCILDAYKLPSGTVHTIVGIHSRIQRSYYVYYGSRDQPILQDKQWYAHSISIFARKPKVTRSFCALNAVEGGWDKPYLATQARLWLEQCASVSCRHHIWLNVKLAPQVSQPLCPRI